MSADNWTQCPKCAANKLAQLETMHRKLREACGNVDADKFLEMREKVSRFEAERPDNNLREDYEIGTYDSGVLDIDYHCNCNACGFGFSFRHSVNVLTGEGA